MTPGISRAKMVKTINGGMPRVDKRRFTAEQMRRAIHAQPGNLVAIDAGMLAQAADTEAMIERIASADPALAEQVAQKMLGDKPLHLNQGLLYEVEEMLRALAAVLKGEATNAEAKS